MLLRKHKSYIYIALVLFALASVAFPKQAIAFEFSVPTEVNAVLMPDGAVVNSSFSTGTNTSEDPLVVSGDLSLNGGFEGSLVFNNQNNTKDIEVNVGDKIDGSVDITKIDNSLDYSKKNIIGSINWSIQPKIKTAFAVFSQDDGSLNFYKRYEVPKAGEQFEGKTATEVYTGIETNRHVPWRFDCGSITNSRVVDKIKPIDTSSWFSACSKLTSIDLSNLDTSAVTDMSAMFVRCSNLTTLDLSGFDTSSVTDMRSMFSDCSSLTTLDLSGFDTSSVIDMGWMFEGCSSLTSLEISNFNTSSVKSMGSMFRNCRKLPQLDLSHFNTYKVTTMRDMFSGCEALTALNITSWNTQAVTNMNSMFFNCFKLTTLDFSSFNASSVTDMGSMFWNCVSLTSLDLSSFNTPAVTDMSFMFSYCRSLVSLNLANFDTSSVTNMNSMFFDCPSLASLDLANFDTSNVTSMRSMFYGCSSLTTLNVSNFNTSSVSSMDSMFENCNELLSLNITNFNTSNVESMSRMFQNCYKLNNLDLSSFNTSSVISIDSMFGSCRNLTTLDLSNFDTSNVTSMSSMFYGCYRLQQIKLGNKFAWKGNGGYLPTPSSRYISGADGKWYAMSDGTGYAPENIPSNKADTYYASKDLLPKMTGNIQISGSNSPGSTLSANVEGVPSDANIGYQWYIGVGSKDFEYVVTDIFVDDGIRSKVGEATLSDKDIILFKGQETGSYSMDAEVINSSGAVVFKKTFNENSNSAYFKPSESGVYKVKVRLISGSTYFDATKRALEFEKIDGETSQSLNILDNQEYRTFMCKAFDKSGKYLGEISSEKVTITPKAKLLK